MWHGITPLFGLVIILAVVVLLAVAATFAIIGLRTASGNSRKARKADALRTIEEVNRAGYLDDVGTIQIDLNRQRRHSEGD
jgi:type II secretory pathway pseudopilin PulG